MRTVRREGRGLAVRVLLLVLCVAGHGGDARGDPRSGRGAEGGRTPSEPSTTCQLPLGRIRRFGRHEPDEVLPARLRGFRRRHGAHWEIAWNLTHETPHRIVPSRPHPFVPRELLARSDDAALADRLRAFVDGEAEIFGVNGEQLEAPAVYRVGENRVVLFRQTTVGGLPIRGASLRVVIRGDGTLGWIKAFLCRDVSDPRGGLLDESSARLVALDSFRAVTAAELQVGFDGAHEAGDPLALWRLEVIDDDGWRATALLDAASGEVIARTREAAYFDGAGAGGPRARTFVFGYRDDPEAASGFSSLFLRGALLREGPTAVGASGEQGVAIVPVASDAPTLVAALESRVCALSSLPEGCFPQAAGAEGLRRELAVMPRDRLAPVLAEGPLPPAAVLPAALDSDADGVPDLVVSGSTGLPFVFEFNPPDETLDEATRGERGFWVTAFGEGLLPLAHARDALSELDLAGVSASSIDCLVVAPLPLEEHPDGFLAAGAWEPFEPCKAVFITRALRSHVSGELEATAGSMVAHEAAHHVFRALAGTTSGVASRFEQVEEGVVDALAAMARSSGRIGYLGRLETVPRSDAFDLDADDTESFRRLLRRQVARALFTLHRQTREDGRGAIEALGPGTRSSAAKLVLLWLTFHRLVDMRDGLRFFGPEQNIYEELLVIDDLPELGGDGILENGTPRGEIIAEAFAGVHLFDAAFVRGDLDGDGRAGLIDALGVANFLFLRGNRGVRVCFNAADANNDGGIDIVDVLTILNAAFLEDDAIPPPRVCGFDLEEPWSRENLGCFANSCTEF